MKRRLLWISLLLLAFVCLYLFYASYEKVKAEQINALNRQQLAHARLAKAGIEGFIQNYLKMLDHLAKHEDVINLRESGKRLIWDVYVSSMSDIRSITRIDARGRFMYTVPDPDRFKDADISFRDFFQALKHTREPQTSNIITSVKGNQRAIAFHIPVIRKGAFDGSVAIVVSVDDLAARYLKDIRIGENGYAWLINQKGIELYCPVPGHIGKTVQETSGRFPRVIAMAKDMMAGKEGVTTYTYDYIRGKETKTITKHAVYMPIRVGNTLWSVVIATPEEEVLSAMAGFRNRWMLIIGLLIVGALFFSYSFVKARTVLSEEGKRRELETALRESEGRYRMLVESTLDLILMVDNHGMTTYVNPTFQKESGYTTSELLGQPFTCVIAPDSTETVLEHFKKGAKGGITPPYEADMMRKDGTRLPMEFHVTSLYNEKGDFIGRFGIGRDISERRRAENILRENEQRLRNIIEGFPIACFLVDRDHRVLQWNLALAQLSGISAERVIGTGDHWRAFYAKERPCMADVLLDEAFDRMNDWYAGKYTRSKLIDEAYEATDFFPDLGQGGKWLRFTAATIRDSRGDTIGAIETLEDITEQKQAEEALRESRQQLADIIDFLPDATFVINKDGQVLAWNRAIEEMTGIRTAEMLGKGDYSYALPFYGERRPILIDLALQPAEEVQAKYLHVEWKGSTLIGEAYMQNLRGKEAYLLGTASVLRDTNGNIAGAIESIRDITARRHAEELYRTMANSAQVGVYIVQDGRIVFTNPHIPQYSGFTYEELIGSRIIGYVHPEDRDKVKQQALSMLQGETSAPYEYRIIDKGGRVKWLMEAVTAIHYDEKPAVLGSTMDITDRKQTEEEKDKLRTQLIQAQKLEALGTLAGGIAHDFNNLLTSIQGHASLIRMQLPPDHPYHERLGNIENLVGSGANLTRQLLGFARGGRFEVRPTSLNDVIRRTSAMFGRTKKEIRIYETYEADLWAVEADQGQLDQVLMNLYVNAWQAMPAGGSLYLETSNLILDDADGKAYNLGPGNYVRVSVTDTGVGMDEKTRGRIFEPFFTTKEMGRGTGLGLATVYGIIKGHRGGITVYSEKGKGTTFNIYLPASSSRMETPKVETVLPRPEGGGETILIVDDEQAIVLVTRDLLESLGYRVLTAHSGPEALEIYKGAMNDIDVVLLDMIMPGMSGGEVFNEIKKLNPDIKLILCSGYSMNGMAQTILDRGCAGFLQKPFSILPLSRKVREVLNRS